ncbi:MAG: biotin synthase BioB, partial [Rickettsiales bacterium]|nr:biotin synthase BioB [Rickettsiales bacterium]
MRKITFEKIKKLFSLPLNELILEAQEVHKKHFEKGDVQLASLISIKTGSCPEDCKYCPQSAHYNVDLKKENLIDISEVKKAAIIAKKNGADRFCMGAAWKKLKDGKDLNSVVEMIKEVKSLNLEACVTLGSISKSQARKLKEAGLDAYNHNIDTSPGYYKRIITTRNFDERLETINNARNAGISVCSGGIIGMGESWDDRARMLEVLSNLRPQPESVPINALVPVKGTPLENQKPINPEEMIKMIATSRIIMPQSRIRLSAGRKNLSNETQILCFLSGANSIFYGDSLLTTKNNDMKKDQELISR